MKKIMFIVYYTKGSYEDFQRISIFVTESKDKACNYVLKFNNIYDRWRALFEKEYLPLYGTIDEIFSYKQIDKAYYEEIEFR